MEYDYEDDLYDEDEEERDFCPTCQGTGRIPAMDFEAIEGHDYFACPNCERGTDMAGTYPFHGTR